MPGRNDRSDVASYRVQLTPDFNFRRAAGLADYFAELGAGDLYCSPVMQAAPLSTHGYDVCDPRQVSRELGGEEGYRDLCGELSRRGLSQILDIVPNHLAAGACNRLWWDVLEKGRESRFAHFFDIDWNAADPWLNGKVLLPVLAERYDAALNAGEFRLERHEDGVVLRYRQSVFPLSPESSAKLRNLSKGDGQDVLAGLSADLAVMDATIELQHYRLAFWAAAGQAVNYRRFFAINALAGVRVEEPDVFDYVHAKALEFVRDGRVSALRVDHIDGLREPAGYLDRLRSAAPGARIIVEKILAPGETLPDWPIEGSTGYDFLNVVGRLFVDPAGESPLTELYQRFTGVSDDYAEIVGRRKASILSSAFGGELDRLTASLLEACRRLGLRDFFARELREAIAEAIAAMSVYRTYVSAQSGRVSPEDRSRIENMIRKAKSRRRDLDERVWEILSGVLLLSWRGQCEDDFAMRFQQVSGAVMAKGAEDTAFYAYNRLVSLNEVGGDPSVFGGSIEDFHRFCSHTQEHWPRTMLATATHDTKRGEDIRLRISMLSEIPDQWAQAVRSFSQAGRRHRTGDMPSPNDEYLFYQTLVGAWPASADRLVAYMIKACREAKDRTNWDKPDSAYEAGLEQWIRKALADPSFTDLAAGFVAMIAAPAYVSGLSQTLLKCTAPGVPDFYQGTEVWDFNLVDPDNRRPVDYDLRRRLLAELRSLTPARTLARMDEGLPKMMVIQRALALRRRRPELFGPGARYEPLYAVGEQALRVVAFVRGSGAITVAPRLVAGLGGRWGDTTINLPAGRWRNEFTGLVVGGSVSLAELLSQFPVALLTLEGEAS